MMLPSSLSWHGFASGETATAALGTVDLFDCTGETDRILFVASQWGCSGDAEIAGGIEDLVVEWEADVTTVVVVTLLISDPTGGTPTLVDAYNWKETFDLDVVNVLVDREYSMFSVGGGVGTPKLTLVDAVTMQVMSTAHGQAALDSLGM
jgi:hypothetical protein